MLEILKNEPMNVICVGDAFVSPDTIVEAVNSSCINVKSISKAFWLNEDKDYFAEQQLKIERGGSTAVPYPEKLDDLITDCDVLFTHFSPVPASLIEKAPNLKAVLTCRGGVEHIDIEALSKRNIPVINVIRNAVPVAEFTLGMIIAMTRNICVSHRNMIEGRWEKTFVNDGFTSTLSNLKVGLLGLGNVGIELATRLKALGVPMIAFDAYLDPVRLERNGLGDIEIKETMEEVFREADIVSLHLRLTPETEKIIDNKFFSIMKPTAYFVNSARGGLVNQQDLIETLREHKIAGAALDVFESEPVPADAGFVGLDNIVLTPHIAGKTEDAIPKSPFLLTRELERVVEKGLTERIVNFARIKL
ncbi:MAG: 2-hydroxyacid dehydrogenase [Clostridiales bacterium]|nr:2-hydroxyacid dehydrogenase [Clostridiales bacterium]